MRLGLIARCDHRGLGQQCRSVFRALKPAKTMVVNCGSLKPLELHPEYFPGATFINGRVPNDEDCKHFLNGLDVVYSAETFYPRHHEQPALTRLAPEFGVKTVCHLNFEFLNQREQPTLWAAPSKWHWDEIPEPKTFLPVPVESDRFHPKTPNKATNFLCVVGRPALYDRAGVADLLLALESVRSEITMTITCQEKDHVPSLIKTTGINLPDNVTLRVIESDFANFWDLYSGQDVLISPRRWGGLSLPHQEACAAGLPVISTAVSPNIDWLPNDWLVPSTKAGSFQRPHAMIDLYTVDHLALAAKIGQFANNPVFYREAAERAAGIGKELSWEQLKPAYEKVLTR